MWKTHISTGKTWHFSEGGFTWIDPRLFQSQRHRTSFISCRARGRENWWPTLLRQSSVLLTENYAASALLARDRIILPTLFPGPGSCFVRWDLSGHHSLPDDHFHSPCAVCHILLFLLARWWVTFAMITASSAWTSRDFTGVKVLMPLKVTQGEKPIERPGFSGGCYCTIS